MSPRKKMPILEATSLPAFLECVDQAKQHLAGNNKNAVSDTEFWYRGLNDGSFTLTPSLYRYRDSLKKERLLFRLHRESSRECLSNKLISWPRVSRMQHYGIPTRLLDWTADLWVAVYFALTHTPRNPCVYVLNPVLLNRKSHHRGVVDVPSDGQFDLEKHFCDHPTLTSDCPLAVKPQVTGNPRLETQMGRFTVQGRNPEPLEQQAGGCLVRIDLIDSAHEALRKELEAKEKTCFELFPDDEGVAQYVKSEAQLISFGYDYSIGNAIRQHLRDCAEHDRNVLTLRSTRTPLRSNGIAFCNLAADVYLVRKRKADQLKKWLMSGPQLLFVTGTAGIGKTNFILHTLLGQERCDRLPFVFFSFKMFGYGKSLAKGGNGGNELADYIYKMMLPDGAPTEWRSVAREMIIRGDVVLALDGLDELARIRSVDAVGDVCRELNRLIDGSPSARIIISCRDHIYNHLEDVGALDIAKRSLLMKLKRLPIKSIRTALKSSSCRVSGGLVRMSQSPLCYEMVRRTCKHGLRLGQIVKNETQLEEKWFGVMLKESGYGDLDIITLGKIAEIMLHKRSDLLSASDIKAGSRALVCEFSKPPFSLFTEELPGIYSFTHQSLREFVLAWCVSREIKTSSFTLLKSSSSFDYEGHEFHDRVRNLIDVETDLVGRTNQLLNVDLKDEAQRNHAVRNLFEMLGELTPNKNKLAARIALTAIPYLRADRPDDTYVTYKTRYNIVRCLERIHWTAPRPYIDHTTKLYAYRFKHGSLPNGAKLLDAFAIRGFHRKKQEASISPPMCYLKAATAGVMGGIADEVANLLLSVIEGLTDREIPEDAMFLAINCTHALIRWLPMSPDLERIESLLSHPHIDYRMKQNLFLALFVRYGARIPKRLDLKRLFVDVDELDTTDVEVKRVFREIMS